VTLPSWTNNPNTPLSTTQIQTEFGGTAPTDLSEYYRNGTSGYVVGERVGFPNGVSTPIPVFGNPLAISNFYGASAVGYAITTDKPNYNEGETITINVTAPVLNGTVLYWTIDDATSTITISPTTLSNGTKGGAQGEAYSRQLTASGGTAPYTFSILVGSLPAGLSLSSGGLISGSPTSAGVTTFTVQAIDNEGNGGVRQYSLSVVNITYLPATLPSGTQARAYSQQLSVSGGTAPYAYSLIGSLPSGLSLSSTGLISGTPTTNGTFSTSIRATFNGGEQGINISYTNWVINAVPTYGASTIGPNPLTVGYSSQSYSQQLTFTGDVVGPVTFVQAPTPNTFNGDGSPYINPLPPGISLSSTGLLSGTIDANTFGPKAYLITATDSRQNTVTSELSWVILRIQTGYILPATLPAGTRGTAYSQQLSVNRTDYTYRFASTGSLPAGLSLTSGGLLAGTPTVNGTFTVNVVAGYDTTDNDPSNDYDRYTATYSLVINAPVGLSISPLSGTLPSGRENTAYSQQLSASGGTAPYTFSTTSPLPYLVGIQQGITLSSGGLLAGTPPAISTSPAASTRGTYSIEILVTDANNNTGTKTYSLVIDPYPLTIISSPSSLPAATFNVAYSQQLTASGGTGGTYIFDGSVSAGNPSNTGLTVSASGLISGTPTQAALDVSPMAVSVIAYDAQMGAIGNNNFSTRKDYSLVINAPAAPPFTLEVYVSPGGHNYSNVYEEGGPTNPPWIDIQVYIEYTQPHQYNLSDVDVVSWQLTGSGITVNDFTRYRIYSGATPNNDYIDVDPITSLSGTMNAKFFPAASGMMTAGMVLYVRPDAVSEGTWEQFTFTATFGGQSVSDFVYIADNFNF
jgi:hypothetical protein